MDTLDTAVPAKKLSPYRAKLAEKRRRELEKWKNARIYTMTDDGDWVQIQPVCQRLLTAAEVKLKIAAYTKAHPELTRSTVTRRLHYRPLTVLR